MNSWVVRFGDARSQLAEEDCTLLAGASGCWLIEKSGLSDGQITMLQTFTNGSYNFLDVVPAVLRLFANIHVGEHGRKPVGLARGFGAMEKKDFGGLRKSPFGREGCGKKGTREVHFAEIDEEHEYPYEFEALNAECEDWESSETEVPEPAVDRDSLEEAFDREMEALVSKVDEADEGNESLAEAVSELETRMRQLTECLLPVRESKKKVQMMRKDRKFGRVAEQSAGKEPGSPSSSGPASRIRRRRCGQLGHWTGDLSCPRCKEWKQQRNAPSSRPREAFVQEVIGQEYKALKCGEETIGGSGEGGTLDSACNATVAGDDWARRLERGGRDIGVNHQP